MKNIPLTLSIAIVLSSIATLHSTAPIANADEGKIIEVVKDSPKDVFQITDRVLYANPPTFGYNMPQGFNPDNLRWLNIYSLRWGMEANRFSMEIFLNDVSKCTETKLSNGKINLRGWGSKNIPGYCIEKGIVTQFRREGNYYKQIHTSKIAEAHMYKNRDGMPLEAEEEYIIRETPGPVPQYDDVIMIHGQYDEIPFLWDEFKGTAEKGLNDGTMIIRYIGSDVMVRTNTSKAWFMKDSARKSPYKNSDACLLIRFPGMRLKSYQKKETIPFKRVDTSRLEKRYVNISVSLDPLDASTVKAREITVSFWARQEHIHNGEVLMDLYTTKSRKILKVTDKWKQYTFDYKLKDITALERANGLMFATLNSGRFYIDGLEITVTGTDSELGELEDDLLNGLGGDSDLDLDNLDNIASKVGGDKKEVTLAKGDREKNRKKAIGAKLGWGMELTREDGVVRFDYDSSTYCPEGDSTASMRFMTTEARADGFEGVMFGGTGLNPQSGSMPPIGTTMKVEFWAKQAGLTRGEMQMRIAPFTEKVISVSDEWKKYEFEFTIEADKATKTNTEFFIGWRGKGKLWLDNLLIYRKDLAPFAILPKHAKAMSDLKPGIIRIWAGGTKADWRTSILSTMLRFNRRGATLTKYLELAEASGANIWLISKFFATDAELDALMEFLAAPADVGFGKVRAKLGHPKPWTDVFKTIYIESGNESCFYFNEVQYTALSNRTFKRIKQSKYFNRDQFKFVVNHVGICGSVFPKWTPQLLNYCDEADFIDQAIYVGGADGVSTAPDNLADADCKEDFYQHVLMNSEIAHGALFEKLLDQIKTHREKNPGKKPLAITCYEGGPGSSLGVKDEAATFMAKVNNSMLMAVPTLDAFMRTLELNCGYACMFHYGGGVMWSSHSSTEKMIPKPATLALSLRNLYCDGDMIEVKRQAGKIINILPHPFTRIGNSGKIGKGMTKQRDNVPLVKCYAFGEKGSYSILTYNLSATESRQIQLKLPRKVNATAQLYTLQAEDLLNGNATEHNIKIQNKKITDFSDDYTFTLAPGAICVIKTNNNQ